MTFSEKMREMLNKGMAASQDIIAKAASQAKTWGEMGALKVEILQLRSQAEKLTAQLGAETYAALAERKEASVSVDDPAIRELLVRITELDKLVAEKEAAFRKLGGKDSELEREDPGA
jgi:threonine dehydratase